MAFFTKPLPRSSLYLIIIPMHEGDWVTSEKNEIYIMGEGRWHHLGVPSGEGNVIATASF